LIGSACEFEVAHVGAPVSATDTKSWTWRGRASGPALFLVVAKSSFACVMRLDVTMKGQGRMDMTELCGYEVADGKIISEQFHR
jgi:hypothetical protein